MCSWSMMVLGVVIVTVVGSPGIGLAQWTLYDGFSSGRIDPAKWYGTNGT